MEWKSESCANQVNEVVVHCVCGKGKVKCLPGIFCIMGMSENVVGPCWDVWGVINLEQFLPLEEHLAAIMSVICYHGPFIYDRAGDVTLDEQGMHLTYRCMCWEDVKVGPHGAQ